MTCPHCHDTHSPSLLPILGLLAMCGSAFAVGYRLGCDRRDQVSASQPPLPDTRVIYIDTPQTPIEVVEPPRRNRR